MNYYGRVSLLSFSILSMTNVCLIMGKGLNTLFFVFASLHAVISWFIGKLFDHYRFLSYHDPLTGVFNRRYVYKVFPKRFVQARKRNEIIGILILDFNDFKEINDKFGHDYGDFILKELCRIVEPHLHKEDMFARWGGDEFVLFVNKDKESFERLIQKIDKDFSLQFLKQREQKNACFSVSIGYSFFPEDATNLSDLVAIADERMYVMKHESMNS